MNANSERGILRKLPWDMDQISAQIRRAAGNAALRSYLFQLLCVQGLWQRALIQLQAAAQLDPAALPMAQTCREAIRCEELRADVFAGRRTPQTIGEPPRWLSLLLKALRLVAIGKQDERFRLCRQTDWIGIGPGAWKGLGQREWVSEAGSHPLLDVRQLRFGA